MHSPHCQVSLQQNGRAPGANHEPHETRDVGSARYIRGAVNRR